MPKPNINPLIVKYMKRSMQKEYYVHSRDPNSNAILIRYKVEPHVVQDHAYAIYASIEVASVAKNHGGHTWYAASSQYFNNPSKAAFLSRPYIIDCRRIVIQEIDKSIKHELSKVFGSGLPIIKADVYFFW